MNPCDEYFDENAQYEMHNGQRNKTPPFSNYTKSTVTGGVLFLR